MLSASFNAERPAPNQAPSEKPASQMRTVGTTNVLIVDPDAQAVSQWVQVFTERGWRVEHAHSFMEALRVLEGPPFDVVLIEMALPDMLGTEAWMFIQKLNPLVTGIITTSSASLHRAIDAVGEGASAYLLKPMEARDLFGLIQELLLKQHAQKQFRPLQQQLLGLFNLFSTLADSNSPEQVLDKALAHLRVVLRYDIAQVYVPSSDCTRFVRQTSDVVSPYFTELSSEQSEYIDILVKRTMESLQPLVITGLAPNTAKEKAKIGALGFESCILVPIIGQKSVYGALVVINAFEVKHEEEPVRVEMLSALCQVVAIALDRAYLAQELNLLGGNGRERAPSSTRH